MKENFKIRSTVIAAMIFLAPMYTNAAGLQSQMDRVFGSMSNVTNPGVYETQRRGVIAGGRITSKNRIFDENLVTFTPPSWKAGCGGVDLFGGSFSFINSEQLVQLLRSIAANAKGYAFQLALDNIAPDISKMIAQFQRKIQELNQHLGNSCQLAQGLVNDLTSGMDIKHKTDASISGTVGGFFSDFFESKQESGGSNATRTVRDNNPTKYKQMTGNLLWKQMRKNASASWFTYGDMQLLESIMSVTGTVIISDMVNSESGSTTDNPDTNPIAYVNGGKLRISDLIIGGSYNTYTCPDQDECTSVSTADRVITGMREQILNMLLGTSSSTGIIYKYANNSGTLTDQEKAFTASMPSSMGSIIRNLAILSPQSATLFATESANAIALAMVFTIVDDFYRASLSTVANLDSPYKKELLETMSNSRRSMTDEYQSLMAQYGNLSEIMNNYNMILQNTRKNLYLTQSISNPSSTR
ncbi:conjugal transfer protein TraH [Comamonas jiangduensis]|uniref:conjugal transfer protein TraH n=1 Tax=Comamonas jiangduensis TaxID=1194168 RepID=UPI003BF8A8A7